MDILLILFNVVFYKLIGVNKSTKNDGPDTDQGLLTVNTCWKMPASMLKAEDAFLRGSDKNLLLEGKWKKKSLSV
jgi:hypothetical protein